MSLKLLISHSDAARALDYCLDLTKFSDKRTPDCSQECPLRPSRDYHFRKETPVTCRECLNQFLSLVLWELGCNAGEICKAEDARWQGK